MDIILENEKRRTKAPYNQLTGEGCYGERECIHIEDAHFPYMYLPKPMMKEKLVKELIKHKTFKTLIEKNFGEYTREKHEVAWISFCELRYKYDFEYYAITCDTIHDKLTGNLIRFALNRGQRELLSVFEKMRTSNRPIRVILLKARQYGGSTLTQLYMNWIQMVQKENWSSVICAHVKDAAITIRGMFEDVISNMIPVAGRKFHIKNYKQTQNIKEVPERGCRITVGSAEEPDSVRSQDVKMAHFSEVAKYPNTDKKGTSKLVGSIVGTIPKIPYTFICFESTANGVGDYFHGEWIKAKKGLSSYEPCFVPWFMIDMYSDEFDGSYYNHDGKRDAGTIEDFANTLNEYETNLFYNYGCTLENINWYRGKLSEMTSAEEMFQDFPSDDMEAFQNSGFPCFKADHVETMRENCLNPILGDLIGEASASEARIDSNKRISCLKGLHFVEDKKATEGYKSSNPKIKVKHEVNKLKIWELPEDEPMSNRYLVSYDPSKGITDKADFGVIRVLDRSDRMYGGVSRIVAEWRGHEDKDIAIWIATQIAYFYNKAKLVIETNTYDSVQHDDDSEFIFETISNYYYNLYSRTPADKVVEGVPVKYGFNTNRQTKPAIIANYVSILREKLYVERNDECLNEARYYEKKKNGKYGAKDGQHDDIIMATMIGLWVDFEMPIPVMLTDSKIKIKKILNSATL